MYWSEGDKISINGTESQKAVINSDEPTKASFVVAGVQQTPYCIAYPAADKGQVKFAAEQTHKSNTSFGDGVTTMYGYGNGSNLTLKSLTGILKIGITGSAKLTKAQISTIDRAPIAGAFDFDFEKGKIVKAAADAKDVIGYSFGDSGLKLTDAEQYMHIAVPAGVYDELYVTLYDTDGGVMYATVKAYQNETEDKSLKAGKVRVFTTPIAYTPNDSVFVIKDKASLKAFAEQAATLTKDVIFVADVDMTDEAWTPIEGYAGSIKGNGYAIKGLTAPLFGTTSAKIKGLHLRDVNITETTIPNVGALARYIDVPASSEYPVVEHCSASGNITVNCVDCNPDDSIVWGMGGLVGVSRNNIAISNCKNNVKINVQNVNKADGDAARMIYVSGVVGYCEGLVTNSTNCGDINIGTLTTTKDSYLGGVGGNIRHCTNSTNTGKITVSGKYIGRVFVAGIMGYTHVTKDDQSKSCSNSGLIEITKDAVFDNNTYIAGMAGCTKFSVSNCTNSGNIIVNGTFNNQTFIAGNTAWIYAEIKTNEISGAHNSGHITIGANATFKSLGAYPASYDALLNDYLTRTNPYIGGCTATGNTALRNSNISGNITFESGANMKGAILLGGIVANSSKWVEDCEHSGNIEFEEGVKISNNGFYGGCVGFISDQGIKNVTNRGAFNFYGENTSRLYIGGIVAQSAITSNTIGSEPIYNLKNYGPIKLEGNMTTTNASTNVGGVACFIKGAAAKLYNYSSATISVAHKAANSNMIVGGVIADADGNLGETVNNAAITIDGPSGNGLYVGGLVAHHAATSQRKDQTNTGSITVKNTSCVSAMVAGLYGSAVRLTCINCHNEGAISVSDITATGGSILVGGAAARLYDASNTATFSNVTNSGSIYVDASKTDQSVFVGGVLGWHSRSGNNDLLFVIQADENGIGAANSGSITVTGTTNATKDMAVGGIIGFSDKSLKSDSAMWTGSIINSGSINCTCSTTPTYIGGIFGYVAQALGDQATYTSTGNITATGETANTHIGGFAGSTGSAVTKCSANCSITALNCPNVGMIMGIPYAKATKATNCKVGGSICTSMIGQGEDAQPRKIELSATNYFNYIYSSADWTGVEDYDGCTFDNTVVAKPEE